MQCCWPSLADGTLQYVCMEPSMSHRGLLGTTGSEGPGFPIDKTSVCKMTLFHCALCC